MSDSGHAAADRGDLKSTSYEFFMLAMAILREFLARQEQTSLQLREKLEQLEAERRVAV